MVVGHWLPLADWEDMVVAVVVVVVEVRSFDLERLKAEITLAAN
jgi:hypothetical protein